MRMGRGWKTKRGKKSVYMCADGLHVEAANKAFKWVLFADRFGNGKYMAPVNVLMYGTVPQNKRTCVQLFVSGT